MIKVILPALLLSAAALFSGCRSTSKLSVVTDFDAERYMGTWYEAARYPHRFEKGLSAVSADYTLNADGTVRVINRGFKDKKQEWTDIEGVAKFKGPTDQGWLKVSFFKPFYASYKIIYLDSDYQHAVVAGPNYNYLWFLTRLPVPADQEMQKLKTFAEKSGYDLEKLIIVDQSRNYTP